MPGITTSWNDVPRLRSTGAALLLMMLGALGAATSAHAASCDTWKNATSGSWTEGVNWSTGAAPTSGESACITEPGTYTVTAKGAAITVKSLTLGGASGTQTLAVATSNGGDMHLATTSGLAVEAHGAVVLTLSLIHI